MRVLVLIRELAVFLRRLEAGYQSGAETGTGRQGGEHAALPAPLWFPLVRSGLIAQDFIRFDSLCATSVIVSVGGLPS